MISFDRLDTLLTPLEDRLEGFIQGVIADMSKALAEVTKVQSGLFAFAKQREARKLIDAIAAKLAKLTPYTETELKRIFRQAGIYSLNVNAESIRRAGLAVPELAESEALTGAVNAVFARTNVVLQNLTRTVAYQSQMQFVNAADDAFLQVTTGTLSIDQAVRQGVLNLASQGVSVLNTFSGRTEQVDTAIMRNVRTAVNQATGDMTLALAAEMGCDWVWVSAHPGARNKGVGPMNHASWQGKVYSISGRDRRFKPFIETTGYGTGEGLDGYNCRHSFYLKWPDHEEPEYTQKELDRINNTTVTYKGQKMDLYSATQEQRRIERGIREWKRKAVGFEAAGLGEEHAMAGLKVRDWQEKLRDFTKQTGLERRREWEQVSGYKDHVTALTPKGGMGGGMPPEPPKPPVPPSNPGSGKISPEDIDFTSEKDQYVADFGDQRILYPLTEPGREYGIDLPVIYNKYAANHLLSDTTHAGRLGWIKDNANDFVKAIHDPEFIERIMRLRNDGCYSVTNIAKVAISGGKQWEYVSVAISLSKSSDGYHQITTIYPVKYRDLFRASGELKGKYLRVK